MIDTKGLSAMDILCALYESAHPQGMGWAHYQPGPLPEALKESFAKRFAAGEQVPIDYLLGRVMKVKIYEGQTTLDERLYDRDNGVEAAYTAIESRAKQRSTEAS